MPDSLLPELNSKIKQLLIDGCDLLNIKINEPQIDQLIDYSVLLGRWNQTYNLTAIRDPLDVIRFHLLDCLAINQFLEGNNFIDVGTGAGLPGIPLAIINPHRKFTLLDSNGKKSRFLLEVKRALSLANVEIETVRVESWLPTKRFDSVVTRAFADLATTLASVDHVLSDQGMVYAMKTQQAQHEIESLPDTTRQVTARDINVPGRDWSFRLLAVQPHAQAPL